MRSAKINFLKYILSFLYLVIAIICGFQSFHINLLPRHIIKLSDPSPESGHAYTFKTDNKGLSSEKSPSIASLYEDGVKLGPDNAPHDLIRTEGKGANSFWSDYLYFSTSDNSDPRTNQKTYEIRWERNIPSIIVWVVNLFSLLIVLFLIIRFSSMQGIILIFFGLGLSLLLTEGILRSLNYMQGNAKLAMPEVPSIWDDQLGFIYRSNASFKHWGWDGVKKEYENLQSVNEWGFLDREIPSTEKKSERILILGDSFIEGMHVPNTEKVGTRLEKKIREKTGKDIDVISLAHSGTGQVTQYAYWQRYVSKVNPNFVILSFYNNDIRDNHPLLSASYNGWNVLHPPRLSSFLDVTNPDKLINIQADPKWNQYILSHNSCSDEELSWFIRSTAIGGLLRKSFLKDYFIEFFTPQCRLYKNQPMDFALMDPNLQSDSIVKEAYKISSLIVDKLVKETRDMKAEPVFFVADAVPSNYVYGKSGNFKTFYNWVKTQAEINNAKFLSISDEIALKKLDYKEFIVKDGHWNKNGHELAAELLTDYFVNNTSLKKQ